MPSAFGYFENYPPFKFSETPPRHVNAELLVDNEKPDYKSKDSSIIARLKETSDNFDFILKEGYIVLASLKEKITPFPYAVYRVDLDKNGLMDFIVFSSNRGCGLASQLVVVDIFLKKDDKTYQNINYEGFGSGLEDFVDLDQDGKYEIIIMDMYSSEKHNYFSYNIYELKNSKLINANSKFKKFPKFIWYTEDKNDKDTTHLTLEEKTKHIVKVDSKIQYKIVPSPNTKSTGIFSGDWWAEGDGWSFNLALEQEGNKLKGRYCAVAQNGNRIDCDPDKDNIRGDVKGSESEVAFDSYYGEGMGKRGGNVGKAKISIRGNKLEWIVIESPKNTYYYCPNKAILEKRVRKIYN